MLVNRKRIEIVMRTLSLGHDLHSNTKRRMVSLHRHQRPVTLAPSPWRKPPERTGPTGRERRPFSTSACRTVYCCLFSSLPTSTHNITDCVPSSSSWECFLARPLSKVELDMAVIISDASHSPDQLTPLNHELRKLIGQDGILISNRDEQLNKLSHEMKRSLHESPKT